MPFLIDTKFAHAVKNSYGDYVETFQSEHRQVRADVFKQGDWLVAHVSFPTGLDIDGVEDKYLTELHSYANGKGFSGRFRLIFS